MCFASTSVCKLTLLLVFICQGKISESIIVVQAKVSRAWDNDSGFQGIKSGFAISSLNGFWLNNSSLNFASVCLRM